MNILDRFSFYGARVMLVLFFIQEFGFGATYSYEFYGAIFALIYAVPILGGWLVDQGFDRMKAIGAGLLLKTIGHFCLVIADSSYALMLSFAAIVLGHMFYKPTILTLYSDFVTQLKKERDRSFTFLFVCFQIGAVLGILICGYVAEKFGWRYGLMISAIVMGIECVLFYVNHTRIQTFISHERVTLNRRQIFWIMLSFVGICAVLYWPVLLDIGFPIIGCLIVVYLFKMLKGFDDKIRRNIYRLCFMLCLTIIYLSFYEQKAVSFNVYIKHFLDRDFFGFELPATWFQMFPSFFMIFFGFGAVWFWGFLKHKSCEPRSYDKYLIGLGLMCVAHLILWVSLKIQVPNMLAVFMGIYLFISLAEAIIYPLVMAATSKYAPKSHRNFFMGLMAFTGSIAHYLASEISKISAPDNITGVMSVDGFQSLVSWITIGFFVCCGVMLVVRKFYIKKSPGEKA